MDKRFISDDNVDGWELRDVKTGVCYAGSSKEELIDLLNVLSEKAERSTPIESVARELEFNEPQKITLTKKLPTEEGQYYHLNEHLGLDCLEIVSVSLNRCGENVQFMLEIEGDDGEWFDVEWRGGYWAKVDESLFEVKNA